MRHVDLEAALAPEESVAPDAAIVANAAETEDWGQAPPPSTVAPEDPGLPTLSSGSGQPQLPWQFEDPHVDPFRVHG